MQICVFREPRLEDWESRPLHAGVEHGPMFGASHAAYVRVVGFEQPGPPVDGGPHRRVEAALRAYRVFPPWLIRGVLRRSPVEAGDTVGIQMRVIPGVSLLFAARVSKTFDGQEGKLWRSGFQYRTLQGHPEMGEETFCVEKDLESGRVTVSLRSWSLPGLLLTRLFSPITRFLQRYASMGALKHLQNVADGAG